MDRDIDIEDLLARVEKLEAGYQDLRKQLEELRASIYAKRKRLYKGKRFGEHFFSFCLFYESQQFKPEQVMKIARIKKATYFRYQNLWKSRDWKARYSLSFYLSGRRTVLDELKFHPELNIRVNMETYNYDVKYIIGEDGRPLIIPVMPNEVVVQNPYTRDGYSIFKDFNKL